MDPVTLRAFRDELIKLADYEVTDSPEKIRKVLKPGDILATQVRNPSIAGRLLTTGLKLFGGTNYTHVGLYAGDDHVIDAGHWNIKGTRAPKEKGFTVAKVPLDTYVDRYKFRVLRVKDAPNSERQDAAEFAEEQVGKGFSIANLLRLGLPVKKDQKARQKQSRNEALQSMACSQLISNAYPKRPFGSGRSIQHVRPVDIQKSRHTKIVGELL